MFASYFDLIRGGSKWRRKRLKAEGNGGGMNCEKNEPGATPIRVSTLTRAKQKQIKAKQSKAKQSKTTTTRRREKRAERREKREERREKREARSEKREERREKRE